MLVQPARSLFSRGRINAERVVEHDWTATSGAEQANQAGVITNPGTQNFTPVKRIFARWGYEADPSFNHVDDIQKYVRFMSGDWGSLILTLNQQWNNFPLLWDLSWGTGGGDQNQGNDVTPNSIRGTRHWYEVELDMSVSGTAAARLWIDGVLRNVQSALVDHSSYAIGSVQFYYTFNGPCRNAFSWSCKHALSTTRIGMPGEGGFDPPNILDCDWRSASPPLTLAPDTVNPALFGNCYLVDRY